MLTVGIRWSLRALTWTDRDETGGCYIVNLVLGLYLSGCKKSNFDQSLIFTKRVFEDECHHEKYTNFIEIKRPKTDVTYYISITKYAMLQEGDRVNSLLEELSFYFSISVKEYDTIDSV